MRPKCRRLVYSSDVSEAILLPPAWPSQLTRAQMLNDLLYPREVGSNHIGGCTLERVFSRNISFTERAVLLHITLIIKRKTDILAFTRLSPRFMSCAWYQDSSKPL